MSDHHEPVEEMQPEDRNFVRALASLKEEIEAVNWYHQRVATCKDENLKTILAHNRDEEIEHACMALEWLRIVNGFIVKLNERFPKCRTCGSRLRFRGECMYEHHPFVLCLFMFTVIILITGTVLLVILV